MLYRIYRELTPESVSEAAGHLRGPRNRGGGGGRGDRSVTSARSGRRLGDPALPPFIGSRQAMIKAIAKRHRCWASGGAITRPSARRRGADRRRRRPRRHSAPTPSDQLRSTAMWSARRVRRSRRARSYGADARAGRSQLALEKNLDLKVARMNPQIVDYSLQSARAAFLPTFTGDVRLSTIHDAVEQHAARASTNVTQRQPELQRVVRTRRFRWYGANSERQLQQQPQPARTT